MLFGSYCRMPGQKLHCSISLATGVMKVIDTLFATPRNKIIQSDLQTLIKISESKYTFK